MYIYIYIYNINIHEKEESLKEKKPCEYSLKGRYVVFSLEINSPVYYSYISINEVYQQL